MTGFYFPFGRNFNKKYRNKSGSLSIDGSVNRKMIAFAIIPSTGMPELVLILVVVLIVFGPGKLTKAGRAMGKAINNYKNKM